MLKEMKNNPVKPASQIFKFELNQDNELWQAILQEEIEIDGIVEKFLYNEFLKFYFRTNC